MTAPRLLILMVVLNVLIVAGGVGVAYWLLKPGLNAAGEPLSGQAEIAPEATIVDYAFHPVEKIIVSLRGDGRERYFVLDLMLQAESGDEPKNFAQAEPLVRNSVVSYLSTLSFEELRGLQITELQTRLEQALFADFASKKAAVPFKQVLVSKLIVQ
ncbi:flagellar basal body-associated protein FliL [Stutzerimonas nosocomialis]|uniref:flagellar basal body-associated FliL family protein n=1 Tax=Stutzerimonas nosocomialis TaxID=1056496 RepID=UPI001108BC81|nr:flagellar basal body-associated FliL family protein [Stutzerimonas nosocomialis]TLX59182.1 flagellar basal body-associated protein FliL [Stutzerimonas nosocomialis]